LNQKICKKSLFKFNQNKFKNKEALDYIELLKARQEQACFKKL
jgi:hypothetical protein